MSHTAQQSHVQLMVCPPHRTGLPISQFTIRCEHRNSRFVLEEQLSYNFDSTPFYDRSTAVTKGHERRSDVTRAADPLAAVKPTCLFIYVSVQQQIGLRS